MPTHCPQHLVMSHDLDSPEESKLEFHPTALARYPVLDLPNEITSDVFIHFLPPYPSCPLLSGPCSPIHLTHICRQWRNIALATPQLWWRAISLSGIQIPPELLDLWLKRTGSLPLSIRIDEFEDGTVPDGLNVLCVILPYISRLEYVQLHILNLLRIPATSEPLRLELPSLRHLDLDLAPENNFFEIHNAPLLKTAVLDKNLCYNMSLPWAQLTSLTLRFISPVDCQLLLKATNLVACRLDFVGDPYDEDEDTISDLIRLAHLESLSITGLWHTASTPPNLLDSFSAPKIRDLDIPETFLHPNYVDALSRFMKRSEGCTSLQRIRITGRMEVSEHAYRSAFPNIPNLIGFSLVF
ncbi:F-box domain-containing protein [Favolaschia claudopus]|uniref:F-box domain-containing protein n=1 Tax=Favolaschia claudopus TaxID=2862362 RepID=A0AAW0CK95_9AGAR